MAARPRPTLHNRVVYDAEGGRQWTLFASEGDFETLSPEPEDLPPAFREAEAFLVLAMALRSQERLVGWMKEETRALVALDPQEDYIAGNEARLRDLVAGADVFLPSAEEVRRLLGHEDWQRAALQLAALGPRIVVVKLGGDGILVHDARAARTMRMGAFPGEVVDTTGAGDAFCGAFTASLLVEPGDLVLAARRGAVAASFAIADYGARGMMAVTADAARRRMAEWNPVVTTVG